MFNKIIIIYASPVHVPYSSCAVWWARAPHSCGIRPPTLGCTCGLGPKNRQRSTAGDVNLARTQEPPSAHPLPRHTKARRQRCSGGWLVPELASQAKHLRRCGEGLVWAPLRQMNNDHICHPFVQPQMKLCSELYLNICSQPCSIHTNTTAMRCW